MDGSDYFVPKNLAMKNGLKPSRYQAPSNINFNAPLFEDNLQKRVKNQLRLMQEFFSVDGPFVDCSKFKSFYSTKRTLDFVKAICNDFGEASLYKVCGLVIGQTFFHNKNLKLMKVIDAIFGYHSKRLYFIIDCSDKNDEQNYYIAILSSVAAICSKNVKCMFESFVHSKMHSTTSKKSPFVTWESHFQ